MIGAIQELWLFSPGNDGLRLVQTRRSNDPDNSRRKPLVLIVDDEEIIAQTLSEILQGEGFETMLALDGKEAVESARNRRPDIVVSDVVLPEIDGVQTAIAIRNMYGDIRILLFSGQAATSDIIERARAEGHDFELLPKPIHPARLLAAINKLV